MASENPPTLMKIDNISNTEDTLNTEERDDRGRTLFLQAAFSGEVEKMEMLREANADIKATDNKGRSAIHLASMNNHAAAVEYLLNLHADARAVDDFGRQPIHLAAFTGALDTIKMLMHLPDVDVHARDNYHRTALHIASKENYVDAMELLLSFEADVTATDDYGRQPHHLAALKGAADALERLLRHPDVDIDVTEKFGHTAYYLAHYELCISRCKHLWKLCKQLELCISILERNHADPKAGRWDDCSPPAPLPQSE